MSLIFLRYKLLDSKSLAKHCLPEYIHLYITTFCSHSSVQKSGYDEKNINRLAGYTMKVSFPIIQCIYYSISYCIRERPGGFHTKTNRMSQSACHEIKSQSTSFR
jgi:hypothetical protein